MATSLFPHVFRLSWLVSYLMVAVPTQTILIALFGAGAVSTFIRDGKGLPLEDFLVGGSQTCAVIGVLVVPLAIRFNHRGRVLVGHYGIEAMDDRGTRWVIAWKRMESVAIVRFWGWRSIRVSSSDGRTVWLPLYVSQPEEYGASVEQYAGAEHPLARALAFARPE